MTDDANLPVWNGIPDKMETSGWHWLGLNDIMVPYYWDANARKWDHAGQLASIYLPAFEYLGPCAPPITRCRNGTKRVAFKARRIPDSDQICVTMNDGSTYYLDSYFWHNGAPVFDIVGKTIPEIEAAAKQYREPKQEDPAQQ